MQVDIIKLAEIVGAVSLILSVIVGGYKLYDKLIDRMDKLECKVNRLESELTHVKKEDTIVIYALRACLDGLHQQGCNGEVTKAKDMIDEYLNHAAHRREG